MGETEIKCSQFKEDCSSDEEYEELNPWRNQKEVFDAMMKQSKKKKRLL